MIKLVELKKDYTLRGIYNEVENSKGLVVMFHGFTGHLNEMDIYLKYFQMNLLKMVLVQFALTLWEVE